MSHNIDIDGNRTMWCQLRGEERMALEDARRSRELLERVLSDAAAARLSTPKVDKAKPAPAFVVDLDTVGAIRHLATRGVASQSEIARAAYVSQSTVGNIARGDVHADVSGMTEGALLRADELLISIRSARAAERTIPHSRTLPDLDVQAVRLLHQTRGVGPQWAGLALGINTSTTRHILAGRRYRNVPSSDAPAVLERAEELFSRIRELRPEAFKSCTVCGGPRKHGRGNHKTCGNPDCIRRHAYAGKSRRRAERESVVREQRQARRSRPNNPEERRADDIRESMQRHREEREPRACRMCVRGDAFGRSDICLECSERVDAIIEKEIGGDTTNYVLAARLGLSENAVTKRRSRLLARRSAEVAA